MRIRIINELPKTEIDVEEWDEEKADFVQVPKSCTPMVSFEARFDNDGAWSACMRETFPPVHHSAETVPANAAQVVKVLADSINMFPLPLRLQILAGIKT